jgi:hypothetical protein
MKRLFIYNSDIKLSSNNNRLLFTEKDFHPCTPFFLTHNILPDSIDIIYSKGVFEVTPYIREVIKRIDDLLVVGGILEIEHFIHGSIYSAGQLFRPMSFTMYEISLCLGNRYLLIEKDLLETKCILKYRKVKSSILVSDTIYNWSFGIISDGKKNERVLQIIHQISEFSIPNYEVLICGPFPYNHTTISSNVKVIGDSDLYKDLRAPISAKKNRIIDNANFNNLVIMHDRISFPSNWFEKIKGYGNYFDVLQPQILDEESKSRQVQDWMYFSGDFSDFSNTKGGYVEYNKWNSSIYIDGGLIIIKKHVIENVRYNENLNWGEAEDLDLCRRLYLSGALFSFYHDLKVFTSTHRHPGRPLNQKKRTLIRMFISRIIRGFINSYKGENLFHDFLSKSNN